MKIIPIKVEDTVNVNTSGLSERQIEKAKEQLLKKHVEKLLSSLDYSPNEKASVICKSRYFFVAMNDKLVICGVYNVIKKSDQVSKSLFETHEVFDYLLYSKKAGFFMVTSCSCPVVNSHAVLCISPAIYFRQSNSTEYEIIEYAKTYLWNEIESIQIKANARTFTNTYRDEKCGIYRTRVKWNILIVQDATVIQTVTDATNYCELPLIPGYIIYSRDICENVYKSISQLINYNTKHSITLRGSVDSFNSLTASSLSFIVAHADSEFVLSDSKNVYFYICKNDTIAYSSVMKCVNEYGAITRIENLFPDDASVNYQICFPRTTWKEIFSFVLGVIDKSRAIYPVIMGCPIHDVIEVLCRDSDKNPYELPQHSIDEISANNVIKIIRERLGNMSNWQIVYLLAQKYGIYAVSDQYTKYWLYHHGENIQCDFYLPRDVGYLIDERIDGRFVKKLGNSTLNVKWKSEYLLYRIVFSYFHDAIMHYTADWLRYQHLDIFIPSLSLGIEYQGEQHYYESDYFGGKDGLADREFLDEQKRQLCKENDVSLVEWPYSTPVTIANLIVILHDHGIKKLPIPDPFIQIPAIKEEPKEIKKPMFFIHQYSKEGVFIARFSSYEEIATECKISKKAIYKAISGQAKTGGGFQWRRVPCDASMDDIQPVELSKVESTAKAVCQITLDGEIVAEYNSIGQASKTTGINHKSISCVLHGSQKTAGGYYWKYITQKMNMSDGDNYVEERFDASKN